MQVQSMKALLTSRVFDVVAKPIPRVVAITTFGLLTVITTRQIVYAVAPQIVEYIATEAIRSALPN